MNDGEALNMGHAAHGNDHDGRYDQRRRILGSRCRSHKGFTRTTTRSCCDKANRACIAHPDKVRRLDHRGETFQSRGPFSAALCKATPVLIQAGQSGRGKQFAARWNELVFNSN